MKLPCSPPRPAPASVTDLEIELLLTAVQRQYGYDFQQYAIGSLRRRIYKAMKHEQVDTISALQARLLHHPETLGPFVDTLSVNVTSMFRDPAFFRAVRERVVPMLRTHPFARIWHAGCATGEEVYSMAIVLYEEQIYERCRLYATDISDRVLSVAADGVYPLDELREHTANYHRSGGRAEFSAYYTASHDRAIIRADLKRNVVFARHNLATDSSFNEFHFIVCRNVLIYFDDTLQDRVLGLFSESLCPFGMIGLGTREALRFTGHASRYAVVDAQQRLYRKVA